MLILAISAVVLATLAAAIYVTYLLAWGAGYDAAVRGSMRGAPLWRQVSGEMRVAHPVAEVLEGEPAYTELKQAVQVASSAMWKRGGQSDGPETRPARKKPSHAKVA